MIFPRPSAPLFPLTTTTQTILTMSKIPSVAILVVGIILLVYGLNASDSAASAVSNAVTGSPTDKSIGSSCSAWSA